MKIILGAGISGLITAFYNPEYMIIAENIGGQLDKNIYNFPPGVRILHATPETEKFLKDLGLSAARKVCRIGYMMNDFKTIKDISTDQRLLYFIKSRGSSSVSESSMSEGKNVIEYFDISMDKIIEKLSQTLNIHYAKIINIDLDNKIVQTTECEFPYTELINTFPLPVFLKLANREIDHDFTAYDTIFVLVEHPTLEFMYDYVYFVGERSLFNRCSKYQDKFIIEINSSFYGDLMFYELARGKWEVLESFAIKNCQIKESKRFNEFAGVKLIGRYAQWDHSIKIQDVVQRALEVKKTISDR